MLNTSVSALKNINVMTVILNAIMLFSDWLQERHNSTAFEDLPPETLNTLLRQFYAEVQTKDGKKYSRSAYVNIRNGINRHLNSPPFLRKINIIQDRDYAPANQVFTAVLKELRRQGLDTTKHKAVIEHNDIEKMYKSGTLSNTNPRALQRKVFFELSLHFARRGREGLRSLTKDTFVIKVDATGNKYITQSYNEKEKNHQGISNRETEKNASMYAQPKDPERCPVKSYELYLSKLNPKCEALFQKPKKNFKLSHIWYDNVPLGHNTLGDMMKCISIDAQLSQTYTNHCIRATTSTALHQAGITTERITAVTGHKNNDSLKHYISGPSQQQKHETSNILHSYGKQSEDSHTESAVNQSATSDITTIATIESNPNVPKTPYDCNTINLPPVSGIGSLFAGASIGTGANISINFNAGNYSGGN
jgi:hypothetical protein